MKSLYFKKAQSSQFNCHYQNCHHVYQNNHVCSKKLKELEKTYWNTIYICISWYNKSPPLSHLKTVFQKIYLVHFWIPFAIWNFFLIKLMFIWPINTLLTLWELYPKPQKRHVTVIIFLNWVELFLWSFFFSLVNWFRNKNIIWISIWLS